MSATEIWTYQDIVEHLLDVFDSERAGRPLRIARRAASEAMRELSTVYRWSYYDSDRILRTSPAYSTGTIAYDHCVTEEHEALTPQGWKRQDQLHAGDMILAYDHSSETSRWERVQHIHRSNYDGQILEVKRRGRCVLRCTENHRFPVLKRVGGTATRRLENAGFVTSSELTAEHRVPICAPVDCPENSALSPQLAAILGWAITDGCGLLDSPRDYGARITQSTTANPDNCRSIETLTGTKQCGPYAEACASWCIPARVARLIKSAISRTADLPWFVTRLSRDAAQAMFDAMLAAEGSCTAAGRLRFTQWNAEHKPIAEAFQILAIMIGRTANFIERTYNGKIRYEVTVRTSKCYQPQKLSAWSHFKGLVWCPQVPSGAWVCRCNGAITITGNSGGTNEQLVTLSGGTFPSADVRYYRMMIAGVHYPINRYIDGTNVTLSANDNPGEDLAAGTSYQIYRNSYPLPVGFVEIGELYDITNEVPIAIVPTDKQHRDSIFWFDTPDTPWQASIRNDQEFLNSLSLVFGPPPSSAITYGYTYHRSARQLITEKYATGTVTVVAGSTTCTIATGAFKSAHIGCVIRFGTSGAEPDNIFGGLSDTDTPYTDQRVIVAVASDGVTCILSSAPSAAISAVKFTISDPLDLEHGAMLTAYQRMCEAAYTRLSKREQKDRTDREGVALMALRLAIEKDNRSVKPMTSVSYNPFVHTRITTDT